MMLKVEVNTYVKRNSMLEQNIWKAQYLVLEQWTKLLKSKLKQSTGWIKSSTKFMSYI